MHKVWLRLGIVFLILSLVIFVCPNKSWAGGFKEKFQQRISNKNVQFQGAWGGQADERRLGASGQGRCQVCIGDPTDQETRQCIQ